jgi:predicted AlkP superfamily pyrophosphatase or phosphodiesterase
MTRFILVLLIATAAVAHAADYVIAVSIDGMGSAYMQPLVDAGRLPHIGQLEAEAAWTGNARNDYDVTVTLPNHVTMVTSRPIQGPDGHNWTGNTDPAKGMTIHSSKGSYVASMFDVAHDNGKRTGVWATKTKFSLFQISYDATHGAPDTTGPDNGPSKVDAFLYSKVSSHLTQAFLDTMATNPCHLAFVHFGETDSAGHSKGWGSDEYNEALVMLDGCVGSIMDFIVTNAALKGKTALLLTADHGGDGTGHSQADCPRTYTVPLFVWGAGVQHGDLYAFNPATRHDPGTNHVDFARQPPPVRNGEIGNVALKLLGLGPIPGSTLGAKQDLALTAPTNAKH